MKRPCIWIKSVEEGKEIQTKSTDKLFHRIIAENFPNLEKERVTGAGSLQNTKQSGPKDEHPPDTS
jgi:hypothetical protein